MIPFYARGVDTSSEGFISTFLAREPHLAQNWIHTTKRDNIGSPRLDGKQALDQFQTFPASQTLGWIRGACPYFGWNSPTSLSLNLNIRPNALTACVLLGEPLFGGFNEKTVEPFGGF